MVKSEFVLLKLENKNTALFLMLDEIPKTLLTSMQSV